MARRRKSSKLVLSFGLLAVGAVLLVVAVAVAHKPRNAQTSLDLAQRLLAEGDVEGSLAAFDRAVEQTPPDGERGRARRFELLTKRGEINLRLRRPNAALRDFELAKELN